MNGSSSRSKNDLEPAASSLVVRRFPEELQREPGVTLKATASEINIPMLALIGIELMYSPSGR